MLKNYLKLTWRNLVKQKLFSVINASGLVVGIACCLLIFLYVQDELSYDRYHENADRIFRIGAHAMVNNSEFHGATSCAPLSATLKKEFPEVEASTRLRHYGFPVIHYGEHAFS